MKETNIKMQNKQQAIVLKDTMEKNKLFSNALAFNILGEKKFKRLLIQSGIEEIEVLKYSGIVKRFIGNFVVQLNK